MRCQRTLNGGPLVAPRRHRVVVTGAGGQLGIDVASAFDATHEVVALDRAALDVGDRDSVLGALGSLRPDLVVNCAAWTAVDACESDPDRAYRDNALGPRHIAEGCRRFGAHLVHVSTDYVFDGTKASPYHEWDEPAPRSVYGASKLAGEREIGPDHTIVRTAWVVGPHGANMVKTVLRMLDSHPTLRFVSDQIGCPTFTADLAGLVRRLAVERRPGLFHGTNQGAVSWFEFVRSVVLAVGEDPGRVEAITTAELDPPRPAPRPANSVLDNAALRLAGLPLLRDFREPLAETIAQLRSS